MIMNCNCLVKRSMGRAEKEAEEEAETHREMEEVRTHLTAAPLRR